MLIVQSVWLFVSPWTIARQALLSMGFSRQEYWSGLPFPSPGDLSNPGIEPRSPALQPHSLPSEPPGKTLTFLILYSYLQMKLYTKEENRGLRFSLFFFWVVFSFTIVVSVCITQASHIPQMVKNLPAMKETQVLFLGWEKPLKKGIPIHSSILAWKIP